MVLWNRNGTDIEIRVLPTNLKEVVSACLLLVIAAGFTYYFSLFALILVFLGLLTHEIGHYMAHRTYKNDVLKIRFSAYEGYFVRTKNSPDPKEQIIISLLGPVFGCIPILIIPIAVYIFGLPSSTAQTTFLLVVATQALNLIPVQETDGAKIQKSISHLRARS